MQKRLDIFFNETIRLLDYYGEQNKLVDGWKSGYRPGASGASRCHSSQERVTRAGLTPPWLSSLGYIHEGFSYPASLCTSVNDEAIHSIPGSRVLHEGDILTLDLAAIYHGWHADAAITALVGAVSIIEVSLLATKRAKKYPLDIIAYLCYNS